VGGQFPRSYDFCLPSLYVEEGGWGVGTLWIGTSREFSSSHLASSGRTSSLSGRDAKGVFSFVVVTSSPESVVTSGVSAPPGDEPAEEEGRPAEGGEDGRPESTLCTSRLSACMGEQQQLAVVCKAVSRGTCGADGSIFANP
jgi:hypothetical protein